MDLSQDYEEMLRILNKYRVKYLIVGAYAMIYYTEPRYTKDMDIWVWREVKNVKKLYMALKEFGAPLKNITEDDFLKKNTVYQIGLEPVRIDILMDLPGMSFEKAWEKRKCIRYAKVVTNIVDIHTLIKSKKRTGRIQDKADVEVLRRVNKS